MKVKKKTTKNPNKNRGKMQNANNSKRVFDTIACVFVLIQFPYFVIFTLFLF